MLEAHERDRAMKFRVEMEGIEFGELGVSQWLKSCTRCSREEGQLVFKPYPKAFGRSDKRSRSGAQPQCYKCRCKEPEGQ